MGYYHLLLKLTTQQNKKTSEVAALQDTGARESVSLIVRKAPGVSCAGQSEACPAKAARLVIGVVEVSWLLITQPSQRIVQKSKLQLLKTIPSLLRRGSFRIMKGAKSGIGKKNGNEKRKEKWRGGRQEERGYTP